MYIGPLEEDSVEAVEEELVEDGEVLAPDSEDDTEEEEEEEGEGVRWYICLVSTPEICLKYPEAKLKQHSYITLQW